MGYFKCTILFNICTISFLSCYGNLVGPCLDNIFTVLLMSELAKIGATKPIFLDSGFPRGGSCVRGHWMVCYHCIVHILNLGKKFYFLCL